MSAGELRERVTIQQGTPGAADAVGVQAVTWSSLDTVWANVEPITGAERLGVSDAATAVNTHKVTIRRRDDLAASMRLLWGSIALEIASVPLTPARSLWTVIECREVPRG